MVILMIRAGGMSARIVDETFPRSYDLAGDEGLGPGGMANALRTTSVLAPIADLVKECAPTAVIANLVAPLGITTRQLSERGLSVVGLCELPDAIERQLLNALPPDLRSVRLAYGGLNHLGWFWPTSGDGVRVLRLTAAARLADHAVVEQFGAIPLSYYYKIFDRRAAARLGLWQELGRAEFLETLSNRVVTEMAARPGADLTSLKERETPWFDMVVAPFIAATLGGKPYVGFLNVANVWGFSNLLPQSVVELRASSHSAAWHVEVPPAPPPSVQRFLSGIGEAESYVYKACDGHGRRAILAALDALGIPAHATARGRLADEILAASKIGRLH
jgi:6-phospho-beta-glucosidase